MSEEEQILNWALAECKSIECDLERELLLIECLKIRYPIASISYESPESCSTSTSTIDFEVDMISETSSTASGFEWIHRSPADIKRTQNEAHVKLLKVKRELEGLLLTIDQLEAKFKDDYPLHFPKLRKSTSFIEQ